MHVLVLYAVGGTGSIIVRPWRLGLVDSTIYSLHVHPDHPIGVLRQLLVNFLGPALAAVLLAVLLSQVREPVARIALAANFAILTFYAFIEPGYLLLESAGRFHFPILSTPDSHY